MISRISWNLIVRSRRACPSRVAQDSFSLGNERFRDVWKSLKYNFCPEQVWMGMPVEIALADSMKSPKSIKTLNFQQFSTFCRLSPHLVISTTPKRLDSVENSRNFISNFFKRLRNVRFPREKLSWATLDGHARRDRTIRFHEISKIHQNPWFSSIPLMTSFGDTTDLDDSVPILKT